MTAMPDHPVLVTGGTGYVGAWIVKQLCDRGATVRATYRRGTDPRYRDQLQDVCRGGPGRLDLFEADLLRDGSFDEAMDGCAVVVHVASPFVTGRIRDPGARVLRPALDGTRNVFGSAGRASFIRKPAMWCPSTAT